MVEDVWGRIIMPGRVMASDIGLAADMLLWQNASRNTSRNTGRSRCSVYIQKLTFKQWHAALAEWEGVATSQYMCAVFCKNHTASMQSIVSLLLIVETLRSAMHICWNLILAALAFNPASQQKHPRVLQSLTCALARVACRMLGS